MRPLLDLVADWASHLANHETDGIMDHLHRHARTGRPLGSEDFIKSIEARLGRVGAATAEAWTEGQEQRCSHLRYAFRPG